MELKNCTEFDLKRYEKRYIAVIMGIAMEIRPTRGFAPDSHMERVFNTLCLST
jgi:hypothetical protein